MNKYYWNYKTPEGFTDMIMFSDGRFLTGLVFEKSDDDFKNRWDRRGDENLSSKCDNNLISENCAMAWHVGQGEQQTNSVECSIKPQGAEPEFASTMPQDMETEKMFHGVVAQGIRAEFEMEIYAEDSSSNKLCHQLLPVFEDTISWLDQYFGKDPKTGGFTEKCSQPDFVPAMKIEGLTPFRRKVLTTMMSIPFGQTMTYGEVAKVIDGGGTPDPTAIREISSKKTRIGKMSAQAVGGAVGWNPICIIIPCHRVMGANGSITGYGGGIKNKIALLKLEGVML